MIVKNNELAAVLTRAVRDVDHQSTMRVLSGLLLRANGPILSIVATNITTTVLYTIKGQGKSHWSAVLVRPREFLKWVKAAKGDQDVEIVPGDTDIAFTRKGRTVKMPSLEEAEFPTGILDILTSKGKGIGTMSAADIVRWGTCLTATASDDETRPYLNCIALGDGHLSSTDGHRLNHLDVSTYFDKSAKIAIAKPAWSRLVAECRVKTAKNEEIAFEMVGKEGEQYLRVLYRDSIRLIKGADTEPPPYDHIIPRHNPITFAPHLDTMVEVIKEAATMTSERHRAVHLSPRNGTNEYDLTVDNPEAGTFEAPLTGEIIVPEGEKLSPTGFNAKFLLDALDAFENPVLHLGGGLDGILIDEEGCPLTHVLMPIRI